MAVLEVNSILALEFPFEAREQKIVKIVASELVVSVAGEDFSDVAFDAYDRDVKRSAAKVVNQGGVMRGIPETVRQTGGRRLIEDAHHLQPGELSGFPRGVALGVRKVGRNGNDRLSDRLMQFVLRPFHHSAKNQRGDLLGRELLVSDLHRLGRTHLSLDAPDGQMRIKELLMARLPAHEQRAGRGEAHTRWQHPVGLRAKNFDLAIDESGDLRIGGSEIDTRDHITHFFHFLLRRLV